jgi:hypothetical protein
MLEYIQAGGQLVVGPGLPYTDPTPKRPGILGQYLDAPGATAIGTGRLIWAEPGSLPTLVGELAPPPSFACDDPAIDLTVLHDAERTLVFTANPTDTARSATLRFAGQQRLNAVWGGEETLQGVRQVALALPAYGVRIWEVTG